MFGDRDQTDGQTFGGTEIVFDEFIDVCSDLLRTHH
jgi:hypothetical protein